MLRSMADTELDRKRAENLWEPFARKFPPIARSCTLDAWASLDVSEIGGLEDSKEEVLTYACAATDPQVYLRWGTAPPAGLLLIGPSGSGKTMLAQALASLAKLPFLIVNVPKLVLQLLHASGNAGELLQGWIATLDELPPITVYFDELDFANELADGPPRPGLPTGPIGDFLLELTDAVVAVEGMLLVGSTSHPDSLSHTFLEPGRFERLVTVTPSLPGDVIAALEIHAARAEKRAGRPLFQDVDWVKVADQNRDASIGNWVRLLQAVLRRKARCDAADEEPGPVTTDDFLAEVERFKKNTTRLPSSVGRYL
jgi:SpoVK/Ycf46/Vps4 family AAA+-type ATPase